MDPFSGQKAKGDALRSLLEEPMPWCDHCQCYHHSTARCISKNPPGWNEPGMQPINWAEELQPVPPAVQKAAFDWLMTQDYSQIELRMLQAAQQDVDRHYQIAFEAWQHQQTRPESRWAFADRMAKLGGAGFIRVYAAAKLRENP
jgi:hypothetical protein